MENEEDHVYWFRHEPLAALGGKWHSDEFDSIEVIGLSCNFDGEHLDMITVEGKSIKLNGWHLVGFNGTRKHAYWSKDGGHVHWSRLCMGTPEKSDDQSRAEEEEHEITDGS